MLGGTGNSLRESSSSCTLGLSGCWPASWVLGPSGADPKTVRNLGLSGGPGNSLPESSSSCTLGLSGCWAASRGLGPSGGGSKNGSESRAPGRNWKQPAREFELLRARAVGLLGGLLGSRALWGWGQGHVSNYRALWWIPQRLPLEPELSKTQNRPTPKNCGFQ